MAAELLVSWRTKGGQAPPILRRLMEHLKGADEAVLASAYVSSKGLELILPPVEKILARGGKVALYATLDMTIQTKPEAFSRLVHLVEPSRGRLGLYLYPSTSSLFHAKAFLVRKGRSWSALVGSANLTGAALSGANFEAAVDCAPIPTAQVNAIIAKLNELREGGALVPVTKTSLRQILALFSLGLEEEEPEPRRREVLRKKARDQALAGKPRATAYVPAGVRLPPLSLQAMGPRELVGQFCATGIGVGTSTELDGMTVSVQLDRFQRAGLVNKEQSAKLTNLINSSRRTGYSLTLLPPELREKISSAGKGVGRRIAFRSIDLGFARWVPRALYRRLEEEIAGDPIVRSAYAAIKDERNMIGAHLEASARSFEAEMGQLAGRLELRPRDEWNRVKLGELVRTWSGRRETESLNEQDVRELIAALLVKTYREYLSDSFVRARLARVSFVPRAFEFPLNQTLGSDDDFGHRSFLASVAWAYTDRLLKRTEGKGQGAVFSYLQARVDRAGSRVSPREMAEAASRWIEEGAELEGAVAEFLEFFGAEGWSWDEV